MKSPPRLRWATPEMMRMEEFLWPAQFCKNGSATWGV